jgi:uncharacterized membrane protein
MFIIASYTNLADANSAYQVLLDSGISKDDISISANESTAKNMTTSVENNDKNFIEKLAGGSAAGAISGGALGFLVGATSIALGTTALLVTGPLALALGGSALAANTAIGAAVGGVGGSLVSGLTNIGVSEDEAQIIQDNLQANGAIIYVETTSYQEGSVKQILQRTNPQVLTSAAGSDGI